MAGVTEPLLGMESGDEKFIAQVEALMELPLDQRLAGLAEAERALRERLGRAEPPESEPPSSAE